MRPPTQAPAVPEEESTMTATYTFDVFSTLDGFGSYNSNGDRASRVPSFSTAASPSTARSSGWSSGQHLREFMHFLGPGSEDSSVSDPINTRMKNMPTMVISTRLHGPLDWPNATLASGGAVDMVARLKEESTVPLRKHGS